MEMYSYDEYRVCELLKSDVKNKGVSISSEWSVPGFAYPPDLYAPDGIPSLELTGKTVIEVKKHLSYATVKEVEALFATQGEHYNVLVVFFNRSVASEPQTINNGKHILRYVQYRLLKGSKKEKSEKSFNTERAKNPDWKKNREDLIKIAQKDVEEGNNALFLGAGVSSSAKMPKWDELLKGLMGEVKLNPATLEAFKELSSHVLEECGDSYLIMARYLQTAIGKDDRDLFPLLIQKYLYNGNYKSPLITTLARIVQLEKVNEVITYNFDDVLEQNLAELGLVDSEDYTAISKDAEVKGHNTLPIYHVHGIIPKEGNPDIVVFSEEEYHSLYANPFQWSNVEQLHALTRMHCFFVGLSMNDPNLRRLLDAACNMNRTNRVNHYAFLRRTKIEKYCVSDIERSCKYVHVSESLIDKKKQKDIYDLNYRVMEDMFLQMGVRVIWFEEFDDLPELVAQVFGMTYYQAKATTDLISLCETKIEEIRAIEIGMPKYNPATLSIMDAMAFIDYKNKHGETYRKTIKEAGDMLNELSARVDIEKVAEADKEKLLELQKSIPKFNDNISGFGDFYGVWLEIVKKLEKFIKAN